MRPRYDDENTIIFLDVSDSTIIVVTISIADFVKNHAVINNLLYKIQALYLHHTFREI